jgi:CIC family chloride channel protein
MKLLKQGINIVRGHDVSILRNLYAGDFMTKDFEIVRDTSSLLTIVDQVLKSPYPHFMVLNQKEEA